MKDDHWPGCHHLLRKGLQMVDLKQQRQSEFTSRHSDPKNGDKGDTDGRTQTAIVRETTAPLRWTWHHCHRSCFLWQPPILPTHQRSGTVFRTVPSHCTFPFLLCPRGPPCHSMDTHFVRNPVPTGSSFRGQGITLLVSLVLRTFYSRAAFTYIF